AQAGHAFDQCMATGEQCDQHMVEGIGLADEGLADLVADRGGALRQRFARDRRDRARWGHVIRSQGRNQRVAHSRFLSRIRVAMRVRKAVWSLANGGSRASRISPGGTSWKRS